MAPPKITISAKAEADLWEAVRPLWAAGAQFYVNSGALLSHLVKFAETELPDGWSRSESPGTKLYVALQQWGRRWNVRTRAEWQWALVRLEQWEREQAPVVEVEGVAHDAAKQGDRHLCSRCPRVLHDSDALYCGKCCWFKNDSGRVITVRPAYAVVIMAAWRRARRTLKRPVPSWKEIKDHVPDDAQEQPQETTIKKWLRAHGAQMDEFEALDSTEQEALLAG